MKDDNLIIISKPQSEKEILKNIILNLGVFNENYLGKFLNKLKIRLISVILSKWAI